MPFKPNKAPVAKALFIFMLVVLSTMGMATVEDAQVPDTLHVDHTPLALRQKRYLRSAADVTSSDRSSNVGVRRLTPVLPGLKDLFAYLNKSVMAPISSYIQVKMWQRQKKTSNDVFTYLQLDKMGEEMFDSPKFYMWIAFVEATTHTNEKAIAQMNRTLWQVFSENEGYLFKILGGVKASHKFGATAQLLRESQMRIWINSGFSVEDAITKLGLDKILENELIGSPEFTMWGAFVTQKKDGYSDALKYLKERLQVEYFDLLRTLAAIHADNENFSFAQSLIYDCIWNLYSNKVLPEELYWYLKLESILFPELHREKKNNAEAIADSLLKEPLGRIWLDYTYMCSFRHQQIDEQRVLRKLTVVFGDVVGGGVTSSLKTKDGFADSNHRIKIILMRVLRRNFG